MLAWDRLPFHSRLGWWLERVHAYSLSEVLGLCACFVACSEVGSSGYCLAYSYGEETNGAEEMSGVEETSGAEETSDAKDGALEEGNATVVGSASQLLPVYFRFVLTGCRKGVKIELTFPNDRQERGVGSRSDWPRRREPIQMPVYPSQSHVLAVVVVGLAPL